MILPSVGRRCFFGPSEVRSSEFRCSMLSICSPWSVRRLVIRVSVFYSSIGHRCCGDPSLGSSSVFRGSVCRLVIGVSLVHLSFGQRSLCDPFAGSSVGSLCFSVGRRCFVGPFFVWSSGSVFVIHLSGVIGVFAIHPTVRHRDLCVPISLWTSVFR